MAWIKETGADGLPIWHGEDSVLNTIKEVGEYLSSHKKQIGPTRYGCLGITGILLVITLMAATADGSESDMTIVFLVMFLVSFVVMARLFNKEVKKPKDLEEGIHLSKIRTNIVWTNWLSPHAEEVNTMFFSKAWTLSVENDAFRFFVSENEQWTVPLDQLARVEVAKTREFSPTRNLSSFLPSKTAKFQNINISEYEWQTFLFLNNGTRRTIYHANAARDDCAELAASIRAYLETAKSAAPAAAAAPNTPPAAPSVGRDL